MWRRWDETWVFVHWKASTLHTQLLHAQGLTELWAAAAASRGWRLVARHVIQRLLCLVATQLRVSSSSLIGTDMLRFQSYFFECWKSLVRIEASAAQLERSEQQGGRTKAALNAQLEAVEAQLKLSAEEVTVLTMWL